MAATSWWSSIPPCSTSRNLGCLRMSLEDDQQPLEACRSPPVHSARGAPSGHLAAKIPLNPSFADRRQPVHASSPSLRVQNVVISNVHSSFTLAILSAPTRPCHHMPSSRQSQISAAAPEALAASQETGKERKSLTGPWTERRQHYRGSSHRVVLAREEKRWMFVGQAQRYISVCHTRKARWQGR